MNILKYPSIPSTGPAIGIQPKQNGKKINATIKGRSRSVKCHAPLESGEERSPPATVGDMQLPLFTACSPTG
jgi:hypothetical protein